VEKLVDNKHSITPEELERLADTFDDLSYYERKYLKADAASLYAEVVGAAHLIDKALNGTKLTQEKLNNLARYFVASEKWRRELYAQAFGEMTGESLTKRIDKLAKGAEVSYSHRHRKLIKAVFRKVVEAKTGKKDKEDGISKEEAKRLEEFIDKENDEKKLIVELLRLKLGREPKDEEITNLEQLVKKGDAKEILKEVLPNKHFLLGARSVVNIDKLVKQRDQDDIVILSASLLKQSITEDITAADIANFMNDVVEHGNNDGLVGRVILAITNTFNRQMLDAVNEELKQRGEPFDKKLADKIGYSANEYWQIMSNLEDPAVTMFRTEKVAAVDNFFYQTDRVANAIRGGAHSNVSRLLLSKTPEGEWAIPNEELAMLKEIYEKQYYDSTTSFQRYIDEYFDGFDPWQFAEELSKEHLSKKAAVKKLRRTLEVYFPLDSKKAKEAVLLTWRIYSAFVDKKIDENDSEESTNNTAVNQPREKEKKKAA
ncbi:MAG: hypothetical protein D6780_01015, partial [Candidatus Dadabacteria bacterium]